MGDARAAVAAETVEVVCRHISRVRQRETASYTDSQPRTTAFQSPCQRNGIKSSTVQPEIMKILYLYSTTALQNIPYLNLF